MRVVPGRPERVADDRQLKNLPWIVGPGTHSDKLLTGTDRKYEFSQVRRERDDALKCLRRSCVGAALGATAKRGCQAYERERPGHRVRPYNVIAAIITAQIITCRNTS